MPNEITTWLGRSLEGAAGLFGATIMSSTPVRSSSGIIVLARRRNFGSLTTICSLGVLIDNMPLAHISMLVQAIY